MKKSLLILFIKKIEELSKGMAQKVQFIVTVLHEPEPVSYTHLDVYKRQLSGIFVTGRDKYEPFDATKFLSRTPRQWFGARFTWDKYFDMPGCSWLSLGLNVDGVITNHPCLLYTSRCV